MGVFVGLIVSIVLFCIVFFPIYFIGKYIMERAQNAVDRLVEWSHEDDEE